MWPARHVALPQTGAAQYYNTICMLKRLLLLFGCVCVWLRLCVCVSTSAGCVADRAASLAIVSGRGGYLLSIHY